MVSISNLKIYDLEESIVASGNAMRLEPSINPNFMERTEEKNNQYREQFQMSLSRAIKLSKNQSNSGHANFLTGIRVSFDIVYPNYFSPELQRYHWVDIVTSSSKMHRLSMMADEKYFNKYVTRESIEIVKKLAKEFNENPNYENRIRLLSNCPQGIELFMRVSTNYMQLRNIYHQRKNHKLEEDWGAFCDMIKTLPYFNEFINIQ